MMELLNVLVGLGLIVNVGLYIRFGRVLERIEDHERRLFNLERVSA
jgi:hypothetical protein